MYGESEVIFSSLKIMLIVGLIIGGIVINAGGGPDGEYIGSQYWTTPGAFDTYVTSDDASRFLAFWKVLLTAAFSYGNIQVAAISGSETGNPQTVIPRAMRKTFVRVFLFYVLSVFIVGLIVPSGERGLSLSTAQRHGRRLSWPLPARASKSRRILSMRSSLVVNITTVVGLIGWVVDEATYLSFYQGLKVQGCCSAYSMKKEGVLLIPGYGFDVFTKGNFTASGFLTSYLNIGIFAITLESKLVPLSDIDFQSELDAIEQEKTSGEYVVKSEMWPWWKRVIRWF
ncbi:hypothetical protein AN8659.2 [Aspergillus nidulans FGSC A4]|uniref:Amino acid transporter (Eurofung) n=1 Tax=Emericella nidulans (strain FGSC A4 / ATCC 38163 / CBS 112.46 / NRRL 194 / M139) TaxID=227321 RepID=Q5ASS1_EMENI|nr:hypothetical protein [Aspergillus nidulans FGSC A4]EAA60693.1 hypothetical protein AN8659.2 [Aspergillus nidulans FGSC A4]CBF78236.1 TPA: amino acid transporter (Eurofung) [Aspergillus nidulans FGSC A4]|eukprot:XP_681928.1 hypothetical protein AN8659.2 [Aspergillus nidulans FGSC A4]